MDLMILHPELGGKELGAMVGYSKSRTSAIMNDPVFQLALAQKREMQSEKVSDIRAELDTQIKEATKVAIRENVSIMEAKDTPAVVKQVSISQILSQGHAKAIEKSAHMEIPVPPDMLRELMSAARELAAPVVPAKKLEKVHIEDDVVDM
jgi:hypothetical protein